MQRIRHGIRALEYLQGFDEAQRPGIVDALLRTYKTMRERLTEADVKQLGVVEHDVQRYDLPAAVHLLYTRASHMLSSRRGNVGKTVYTGVHRT